MEIAISKITGLPIVSIQNGMALAVAGRVIIDPDSGRLVALLTKKPLLGHELAVGGNDIREISRRAVLLDSADALTAKDEIVKIAIIDSAGIRVLGNSVKTELGTNLGVVKEAFLDLSTRKLSKIIAAARLFTKPHPLLPIPADRIVRITKQAIIVKDELIKEAETQAVPATLVS